MHARGVAVPLVRQFSSSGFGYRPPRSRGQPGDPPRLLQHGKHRVCLTRIFSCDGLLRPFSYHLIFIFLSHYAYKQVLHLSFFSVPNM